MLYPALLTSFIVLVRERVTRGGRSGGLPPRYRAGDDGRLQSERLLRLHQHLVAVRPLLVLPERVGEGEVDRGQPHRLVRLVVERNVESDAVLCDAIHLQRTLSLEMDRQSEDE